MKQYSGEQPQNPAFEDLENGRYRFRLVYREVAGDYGLAVHVFGPANNRIEEVLRFDCFESQPHYHLDWSYRDEPFISIAAQNPFEWSLALISSSFSEVLEQAEADSPTAEELAEIPQVVSTLRMQSQGSG